MTASTRMRDGDERVSASDRPKAAVDRVDCSQQLSALEACSVDGALPTVLTWKARRARAAAGFVRAPQGEAEEVKS